VADADVARAGVLRMLVILLTPYRISAVDTSEASGQRDGQKDIAAGTFHAASFGYGSLGSATCMRFPRRGGTIGTPWRPSSW
jgi:hypothetical protein